MRQMQHMVHVIRCSTYGLPSSCLMISGAIPAPHHSNIIYLFVLVITISISIIYLLVITISISIIYLLVIYYVCNSSVPVLPIPLGRQPNQNDKKEVSPQKNTCDCARNRNRKCRFEQRYTATCTPAPCNWDTPRSHRGHQHLELGDTTKS